MHSPGYARSVATRLDKAYDVTRQPDNASRQAVEEAIRPWMDEAMRNATVSTMGRVFTSNSR